MPEYNPASSPVTQQAEVQITPVNSAGVATISLRGFGPNRNLSLVDGKRQVPVNALLWTDINGIPSSMIERVETISGGASAVYGADAIAGVTNFILRRDFEGFEFDAQYGIQEAGDGDENRISMLLGVNLANGRGNITFGAERYDRKKAEAKERDWYTDKWADPRVDGYFWLTGYVGYEPQGNGPNWGAVKALFGGQNPSSFYVAEYPDFLNMGGGFFGVSYMLTSDGKIWLQGNPVGESRTDIVKDGLQYAGITEYNNQVPGNAATYEGIKWNNIQEMASAPQGRYSFFVNGDYDVTDKINVFGGARFAQSRTHTLLFSSSLVSGWETNVPYNPTTDSPIDPNIDFTDTDVLALIAANPDAFFADPDNANPDFIPSGSPGAGHPVPAELAWLLNTRATQDGSWQPQWNWDDGMPHRQTENTIQTWQLEGGLDFELPFRDWSGEIYLTHGESATYNEAGGNLSLTRARALLAYPDWARGASGTGNQWYAVDPVGSGLSTDVVVIPAIRPGFGVGDFTCTSGLYDAMFSDVPMSEDCFNAINAKLQTRTEVIQEIVELNLQGGLLDLPAGELRTAAGFQNRKIEGKFNPDILQSSHSFMDQVAGVYPTGYLDASTHVRDWYIEALVPVLSDLPFMQKLELELGARYSDYEETNDTEMTYKSLGNWEVKDWLRLRGGYNRATRAPNLGELFLNTQEVFMMGAVNFGDPCSPRANAPWGAGGTTLADDEVLDDGEPLPSLAPGQTQAGADRTKQICDAMMGTVASNNYYEGIVGSSDVPRDFVQQGAGSPFNWVLQEGNPLLNPETADTWTLGFIMSSPFENPWISGITLALDWYSIEVEDAIMTYSVDYANFRCFGEDTGLSPAEQALTPGCQLTPRDQYNGSALTSVLSYDNQATISTKGFDVMFNWHADIAALGLDVPGSLNFNLRANVLDSYETRQSPAVYDVPVEWKGSLGPNLPGTQAGAYDYRIFGTLTYNNPKDSWSVSLRWRHLPPVWTADYAAQQAVIANNASVAAGGSGITLGYTPIDEIESDSYNIFDLSATWDINDTFQLRAGITNLFETEPVLVGNEAGRSTAADLDVCGDAPGCSNPNSFSLPSVGNFPLYSGGYYDTLGRRFFMGIKMRF
ncbi:TonB-dependent receptor domain-containing protein [Thermodesulfobacteriota bacterium]